MDDVVVARALHVLAVVIWIGGVAMATTVMLPAVRGDHGLNWRQAFQAIEHRFAEQARIVSFHAASSSGKSSPTLSGPERPSWTLKKYLAMQ